MRSLPAFSLIECLLRLWMFYSKWINDAFLGPEEACPINYRYFRCVWHPMSSHQSLASRSSWYYTKSWKSRILDQPFGDFRLWRNLLTSTYLDRSTSFTLDLSLFHPRLLIDYGSLPTLRFLGFAWVPTRNESRISLPRAKKAANIEESPTQSFLGWYFDMYCASSIVAVYNKPSELKPSSDEERWIHMPGLQSFGVLRLHLSLGLDGLDGLFIRSSIKEDSESKTPRACMTIPEHNGPLDWLLRRNEFTAHRGYTMRSFH